MQLSITGKQLDVSEALRDHIEQALRVSIAKYFENAADSQVTMSKDGHGFRTDITVRAGKRVVIQGHAVTRYPYAALDVASSRTRIEAPPARPSQTIA
jgi:ribosomal subunit interface protein